MPIDNDTGADRDAGDEVRLRFTAVMVCQRCDNEHDVFWVDDSLSLEDLVDAPVTRSTCPTCGYDDEYEYPGWTHYSDAG